MTFSEASPVLHAIGIAEAKAEPLDLEAVSNELGLEQGALREAVARLEAQGLVLGGLEEQLPPIVRTAGRQYLALRGDVPEAVINFLPQTIDDLNTRRALLHAGTILVDEFRLAVLAGDAVDHARQLVPDAFSGAITDSVALDLFAAAVALTVRLSDEAPAGCVAEEILAVALIDQARSWLEMQTDTGILEREAARSADGALNDIFELFQDDDVLDLFDMKEPADAAVAGHSWVNRQLGVADQRLEAWFLPFSWTAPTGYLADPGSTER